MKKQLSLCLVALGSLGAIVYFAARPLDGATAKDRRQEMVDVADEPDREGGADRAEVEGSASAGAGESSADGVRSRQAPIRRKAAQPPLTRPKTTQFLTGPAQGDPLDIALEYLREPKNYVDHKGTDFDDPQVTSRYVSKHNGVTHINLRQRHQGIEVYNGDISVNIMPDGSIINLHNGFVADLAAEVNRLDPVLSAEKAVRGAAALYQLKSALPLKELPIEEPDVVAREHLFGGGEISQDPIPVKLVFVPLPEGTTRLAWNTVIRFPDNVRWLDLNVDAETGELLSEANWINGANYNVYPKPVESPAHGGRQVLVDPHHTSASPFGWHDTNGVAGAEFTDTRGNNVNAQEDADDNNTGGLRPDGGASLNFDFAVDLGQAPTTYQDAVIANLFYWNNIVHDVFWHYGFDEAAGNFQENNYGNGGLGGDPVEADAQDGSGTNNANFGTPPDGSNPRMQMYIWTYTTPNRDSSFDNGVIIHEYGHGISNRLTGGAANASALQANQSRGMGEGWSDFLGLALTAEAADTATQGRGIGTYVLGQPPTGAGIRPYRYTTDMSVNPQTFGDLNGGGLSVPHGIGSVWCTTLWEVYWALVGAHGYDTDLYTGTGGNNLAIQLIIDGMKLQPSNPTYLEARDAIIQADQVNNAGANYDLIWAAFAKRGMGFSADDGGDPNSLAVTEAFDVPDDLLVTPPAADVFSITGEVGGPFTPSSRTFTLENTGTAPLNWTASASVNWLDLSVSSGSLAASGTTTVDATVNANANSLPGGVHQATVDFVNQVSGQTITRDVTLTAFQVATYPFTENFESGTLGPVWLATGTGTARTQVVQANSPNSGNWHLTMDSSVDSSASRNELTMAIDLAGQSNIELRFWAKEFGDESDGPPSTPFVGGADFDGVAISEDGTNWYEVQPLRAEISGTYQQFAVNLDAAIATHGLSYNSSFWIRFNHFDNFGIPTDGFAFDDIEIRPAAPEIVVEHAGTGLSDGFSTVAFSAVAGASDVRSFTIRNVGSAPLTGLSISKSGADSADFTVGALGATTLAGGASTTFDVTFAAPASPSQTFFFADIDIASNDADENPFDVGLSGMIAPDPVDLPEAVDQPGAIVSSGGTTPWFGQTLITHDGLDAAQSGAITHSQNSWMETTVTGPDNISFYWKVDSEASFDFLRFYDNGVQQQAIDGNVDWVQVNYAVPAGSHTLRWEYTKDGSVSSGADAGWVDQLVLPAASPEPTIISPLTAGGLVGDPFSYQIVATQSPTSYASGALPAGLSLNTSSGLILGTPSVAGTFPVDITATNASGSDTETLVITIAQAASLPFVETFESGTIGPVWTVTGTGQARTIASDANGPYEGSWHLTMDSAVDSTNSRNELTLTIDLAGESGVGLAFWAKDFNDEAHGPPPIPFVGGADFDGVAISEDGTNWYEVQPLRTEISGDYQQFAVDLDAAIAAHGLSYNSSFQIRFNHYDNFEIATDGFAFDNILVDHFSTPPNDNWTNATVLSTAHIDASGTNFLATIEGGEPDTSSTGATVWWRWQAPGYGTMDVGTLGSDFDTYLHVYETGATLSDLVLVAENNDAPGVGVAQSQISTPVVAGRIYDIRVGGYRGAMGTIDMHVDFTADTGTPAIVVEGFGQAIANGDSTPDPADGTDFGETVQGTFRDRSFTIRNTGNATLHLIGAEFGLSGSADFSVLSLPDRAIAPAGTTTFDIRYFPPTLGTDTATVSIETNAGNFTFDLGGEGAPVEGDISGIVWADRDADGTNNGELGHPGITVYIDLDDSGTHDGGEPSQTSAADGSFLFEGLAPGLYTVATDPPVNVLQTSPGPDGGRLAPGPGFQALAQQLQALKITNSPTPMFVDGEPVQLPAGMAPNDTEANDVINVDAFRADPRFAGIDGSGWSVAILDTGIDVDHPAFGPDANSDGISDRIIYQFDFADNDADASDFGGHGSNVASLAASSEPAYLGVAPAADIVVLKVFPDSGGGNFGMLEAALDWVANNGLAYNIAAINMSLGDSQNHSTPQTLYGVDDEMAVIVAQNINVVSSAGNDFFPFGSAQGSGYPGADPSSMSIGATFDANIGGATWSSGAQAFSSDVDRLVPFSQRSASLTTIFASGALATGASHNGGITNYTGTSQASPMIAGVCVLAQQLAGDRLGRRLTQAELITLMQNSAVTINDGDDEDDNVTNTGLNFPRIDMLALGEAILAMAQDPLPGTWLATVEAGKTTGGADFGVLIGPEITVEEPVGNELTDAGSTVNFGTTNVGTATQKTFTIRNVGNEDLTGLTTTIVGAQSGDFSAGGFASTTLVPGASTTLTVTFSPAGVGARGASLRIGSNDVDENPFDISLLGTGTTPEIVVEQPVGTGLTDGGNTVGFGNVNAGSSSQRVFTIRNTGSGPLTGLATTIDGADADRFSAGAFGATTLNPGESTTVTLTFAPIASGGQQANLHIASNDLNENPFDVTLSGTGRASEIAIEQPVLTDLSDGVSSVSFGDTNLNESTPLTFVIRNVGNEPLTGLVATIDGAQGSEFSAGAFGATTLNPGASTTLIVNFSPTALGTRNAALHIANNDPDENPFDIALSGNAVTPEIAIEQPLATDLTDGGSTIDYGDVAGGQSSAKTFTIRNVGDGLLTGLSLGVDGTHSADFVAENLSSTTIVPGGTATFTVTFTPSGAGTRTAAVHVSSNDADENPFDISLTGLGLDPEIAVEEPELTGLIDGVSIRDIGSTNVGTAVNKTFTIRNVGNVDLEDLEVTFSGANAADFSAAALAETTVSSGNTTTVVVSFSPTAVGPRTATLEIASNDRDENPFEVTLTGFGTQPEIAIEEPVDTDLADGAATVDFGGIDVNQSVVKTFTIRNSGDGPLTGLALGVSGPNAAEYTPQNLSSTTVAVNSTATFQVTFTPSVRGTREASLQVSSNDADENPFDIDLTGVGLAPEIAVEDSGTDLTSGIGSISFGNASGQGAQRRTVTIRNVGNAELTGLATTLLGTNAADFSVGEFGATSLMPGETTTAIITFSPGALGARTASIEIASNDADENPFEISLIATGVRIDAPARAGTAPEGFGVPVTAETAGDYAGLVEDSDGDPAGWFAAKRVRSTGAFSAKFSIDGVSQTIRGVFDLATGAFAGAVSNRSGATFEVALQLEITSAGRQIVGTIEVGGETFAVRATRSSFHRTYNPAPWEGRYTMLFPSDSENGNGAVQPLGDGYATGSISSDGKVRITGRLGDGTRLTLATVAGADGTLQLFRNIYRTKPKGFIGGTLFVRDVDNISEIDGTLNWVKFPDTREKLYPAGFDLDQPAVGSIYKAPFRNERILSSLGDVPDNATLMIAMGNVAPIPELVFTWTATNKIAYTPTGTEKMKLRFAPKTGAFTGSYVDRTNGQNIKMAGVVLQAQQIASGYFVGNGQTGYVQIESAVAPEIEVRDIDTNELLTFGSTSQFGDAGFEGGSAERSFVIANIGDGDLLLTKSPLITQAASHFAVTASHLGVLKPGESSLMKVVFRPTQAGSHTAEIGIYSNDRGNSPLTFQLVGNGIAGSLATVAGGEGDFAGDAPGDRATGVATSNALPGAFPKSTFSGIVFEDSAGQALVGYLSLKLNKGGLSAFSASYWHDDGRRYGIKNTFDPGDGSVVGAISKPNGDPVAYTLQLLTTDATGDLRIEGTMTDGSRNLVFVLTQNGFDKLNPVDASLQGRYTMLIPGNSDLGRNFPHGDGAISLSVSDTGKIRAGGKLGDGTAFSQSAVLSRDLEWQLFRLLYSSKPKGSIGGVITFRDLPGVSDFDGVLHWIKPANSRDRIFARGFELNAQAIGSKYTPPLRGFVALPNLVDSADNAEFSTNDPGITPNPGTLSMTWDTRNVLTVPQVGTEALKLRVTTRTGLVSGSYRDRTNGVSSKIQGIIFQKQSLVGGTSSSGSATGSILIVPKVP